MNKFLLSALLSASLFASPSAFAAEAGAATAFVQARADIVVSIVNGAASPGASVDARRNELRAAIRDFLSYELLAERTLGQHWEARTPEERTEFVRLLRELIETSYSRRLGSGTVNAADHTVVYDGERSRRGRTTVDMTVAVSGATHAVEIKLEERDGGFVVYDVVTDDVSLEESYAESFASIIRERGWDGLLSRMRERLTELQR